MSFSIGSIKIIDPESIFLSMIILPWYTSCMTLDKWLTSLSLSLHLYRVNNASPTKYLLIVLEMMHVVSPTASFPTYNEYSLVATSDPPSFLLHSLFTSPGSIWMQMQIDSQIFSLFGRGCGGGFQEWNEGSWSSCCVFSLITKLEGQQGNRYD